MVHGEKELVKNNPSKARRFEHPNQLKFVGACLLLLFAPAAWGQTASTSSSPPLQRPIHMLVIGDSILWGQGLKTERKTWHLVKLWLEKNTGRKVIERIEAHSGAVIERASATDDLTSDNREVNLSLPTLHEELDNALKQYADPAQVDLILLSGCGNDVGVLNLLNAVDRKEADEMTRSKCGKPVENLLQRILTSFPNAYLVVTGYYPFFSERTRNDFIVKALAKKFFKTRDNGATRTSNKEIFERLKVNSRQWYESSNSRLAEAVNNVNTAAGNSHQRVVFARIDFPPNYSFAAPKTHLWGLDRSPFRMMLLMISFGKVLLPSNDQMRGERSASCSQIYKPQPNETLEQKNKRKANKLLCRYAALGHPNKKGAVLYADTITSVLKSRFGEATATVP
jgi:lysophospholipase L1-like esterase